MTGAYEYWLLDLDGTLVDVEWAHVRDVFDEVGARLGRRFTDEEAEVLWHGLTGSRNDHLEAIGVDVDAFWEVFHDVEDPQRRAEATFLYEDAAVVGTLDEPVGVVTHCQSYLTRPVLDHLDIRDWFDVVVCCDEDLGWKPDPRPVEYTLGQLGVGDDTQSGVLVGDGANDVGAAWNAGLDAVHVERHGHHRRGQCVVADHRVGALTEFEPFDPAG
jgi:phosphoglycolate phosphatase